MNEHIIALGSRLSPRDRKLLAALAKSADEEVTASGVRTGLSDEQNERLRAVAGDDATGFKLCLAESVGKKFVGPVRRGQSGDCVITVAENERFISCTALFIFDLIERLRESSGGRIRCVAIEGEDGEVSARFAEVFGALAPLADGADVLVNGVPALPDIPAEEDAPAAEEEEKSVEPVNEPEHEKPDGAEAPEFQTAPIDLGGAARAVTEEEAPEADTPDETVDDDLFDELFDSEPWEEAAGYCPCCGRQVRDSSLFCGYCGTPFIDRMTAAL